MCVFCAVNGGAIIVVAAEDYAVNYCAVNLYRIVNSGIFNSAVNYSAVEKWISKSCEACPVTDIKDEDVVCEGLFCADIGFASLETTIVIEINNRGCISES